MLIAYSIAIAHTEDRLETVCMSLWAKLKITFSYFILSLIRQRIT